MFCGLNLHGHPACGGDPPGCRSRPESTRAPARTDHVSTSCVPHENSQKTELNHLVTASKNVSRERRRSFIETLVTAGCFFFFGAPRGVGRPSTKTLCARPRAQTEFVSNHIWHCHHTVISCPDTNSTATRSWRSNRIFSEPVWRYKGTVTVPLVISICAPLASPPPPSAGKVQS